MKELVQDGGSHIVDRDPLLAERQTTHGSFSRNAAISQRLKALFAHELVVSNPATAETFGRTYRAITDVQAEALDMIALKLSRILSGKCDEVDHWKDIAGYANLVVEDLTK